LRFDPDFGPLIDDQQKNDGSKDDGFFAQGCFLW